MSDILLGLLVAGCFILFILMATSAFFPMWRDARRDARRYRERDRLANELGLTLADGPHRFEWVTIPTGNGRTYTGWVYVRNARQLERAERDLLDTPVDAWLEAARREADREFRRTSRERRAA